MTSRRALSFSGCDHGACKGSPAPHQRGSSPRPAAGAPISAPIDWDELDDPSLRPDGFTIRDIHARLEERGDLFADILHTGQSLPPLR